MRDSFKKHRAEAHITLDDYVRARRVELGQKVMLRDRIYLDMCYWIRLRDVVLGRRKDEHLMRLLEMLRASVRNGRQICPISPATFLELFKQQDDSTRLATAQLIDELSEGVTLIPHQERVATEVAHFFHDKAGYSVYPLSSLVWSRLSCVLGEYQPVPKLFDNDEKLVIQKSYFDYSWRMTLVEMLSFLDSSFGDSREFGDIANRLNELNSQHASGMKNFSQVYQDEFIGGLSLAVPVAREVFERMYEVDQGKELHRTKMEKQESERELSRFLFSVIKHRKDVALQAFRTIHIGALCHAAVRWDQRRKLTGNDLFDFHHAEAAIAYCDVFLTEKPLQSLLQQKHTAVEENFPCRIISSVADAVEYLSAR